MKTLYARRAFTKDGITIITDIDFIKKTISLVEKDGSNKKWVFAQRTTEFMNGWRRILAAMQYAIDEAQKELDAISEQEHKEFMEKYALIDQALKKGGKQ